MAACGRDHAPQGSNRRRERDRTMTQQPPNIPDDSAVFPCLMEDMLERVDQIHRSITRANGRIEYLKIAAYRGNSALRPVRNGRGVEHSSIEFAVLESEAERWGIGELQKELKKLLEVIRPLVQRLPAGVMHAVAAQRILEGIPCGIIARQLHVHRSYVYRLLRQAGEHIVEMYKRDEINREVSQKNVEKIAKEKAGC